MFTYQSPQINQALWLSGLSNQSVAAFQNLVGQCRAALVHRGPVQFDYTQPSMRLILPDSPHRRKGPLPPPQDFPPPPPPPEEPVEQKPRRRPGFWPPEHDPNEDPGGMPDVQDDDNAPGQFRYQAGQYINIREKNRKISLLALDAARHCVFPNGKNLPNVVHSVDFKATSSNPEAVDLVITDNPFDTTFHLKVSPPTCEIRYGQVYGGGEVWSKGTCKDVQTFVPVNCGYGSEDNGLIEDVFNVVRTVRSDGWVIIGRTNSGEWILLDGPLDTIKRPVMTDVSISSEGEIMFSREEHEVISKEEAVGASLGTTEVTAVECITLESGSLSAARKKFFAFLAADAEACDVDTTNCPTEEPGP